MFGLFVLGVALITLGAFLLRLLRSYSMHCGLLFFAQVHVGKKDPVARSVKVIFGECMGSSPLLTCALLIDCLVVVIVVILNVLAIALIAVLVICVLLWIAFGVGAVRT